MLVLGALNVARYSTYHARYYDLGVYEQRIWAIASGDLRSAVYPHFSPVLLPVAMIYRVWPDARVLLIIQGAVVALGAWPAYLLGRRLAGTAIGGFASSLVYLNHPAVTFAAAFDFHPDSFVVPVVLGWTYFAEVRAVVPASLCAAGSLMVKEPLLPGIALHATFLAIRNRKYLWGGVGAAAFVLFLVYAVVAVNPVPDMVGHVSVHRPLPEVVAAIDGLRTRSIHIVLQFASVGFFALMAPLASIGALPAFIVALLQKNPVFARVDNQYGLAAAIFLLVGGIYGASRHERRWTWHWFVGCAVVVSVIASPYPWGRHFLTRGGAFGYPEYLWGARAAAVQAVVPHVPRKGKLVLHNGIWSSELAPLTISPFPRDLDGADAVLVDTWGRPFVEDHVDPEAFADALRRVRQAYDVRIERDGIILFVARRDARLSRKHALRSAESLRQ